MSVQHIIFYFSLWLKQFIIKIGRETINLSQKSENIKDIKMRLTNNTFKKPLKGKCIFLKKSISMTSF
jgi:hypothetical protein